MHPECRLVPPLRFERTLLHLLRPKRHLVRLVRPEPRGNHIVT